MARKLVRFAAAVIAANMSLAPALAADIRPTQTMVAPAALNQTLSLGRVGATPGRQENLLGGIGATALFIAIPAAFLAGFAIFKAADNDSPSSR